MSDDHRTGILGAGCAGMMCAIRLAHRTRRRSVGITLNGPAEARRFARLLRGKSR